MSGRLIGAGLLLAAGATVAAAQAPPAANSENHVDLALVLAVDVSRSMDSEEQRVQRNGYVDALRAPEILEAIQSGAYGQVAVTYMEWSSSYYQQVLVPWTVIASKADLDAFASALAAAPITTDSRTSISNALLFAQGDFGKDNVTADRRTVDVSGDGPNNDGVALGPVRDRLVADGITINGLPIIIRPSDTFGPYGTVDLGDYYKACVTGGPNSFVIPIRQESDFETAIQRKLILEIAAASPQVVPAATLVQATPPVDCGATELQPGFGLGNPFQFNP